MWSLSCQRQNYVAEWAHADAQQANATAGDNRYVGAKVRRRFEGHGEYVGTVVSTTMGGTDCRKRLYHIQYEDGDEEDLSGSELAACILDDNARIAAVTTQRMPSSHALRGHNLRQRVNRPHDYRAFAGVGTRGR